MNLKNPAQKRKFLPANFTLTCWDDIQPFYDTLLNTSITTIDDFEVWLLQISELDAFVEEQMAWRYIRMTCDINNTTYQDDYQNFITEIRPKVSVNDFAIKQKMVAHRFFASLKSTKYFTYFRKVEQDVALFNQENTELLAQTTQLASQYSSIMGALEITHNNKILSVTQAVVLLKESDRALREVIWFKIGEARKAQQEKLDQILSDQIKLRNKIAINAGFDNFRDYMFAEYGRFDYTPNDCFDFHAAIKQLVVPMRSESHKQRVSQLKIESVRPWDLKVDPEGLPPLKPFNGAKELLEKGIAVLRNLDSFFADCLLKMNDMGHFDLEARQGKAPGGYNYPLPETGAPFIFMNASGTLDDVITFLHESGHAIHSFLADELQLNAQKATPMEVAEVASMAMELISMQFWNHFFKDSDELRRAKLGQLERTISVLPWIATVDAFQHWLYTNPNHSIAERHAYWKELLATYIEPGMDFNGLDTYQEASYQAQLHLYEVPFYYIEYGIAQLAALGIWKNAIENQEKALEYYKKALKIGFTKPIPDIYNEFGIKFDFSASYLQSLMMFVASEQAKLKPI